MDFDLNETQQLFKSSARELFAQECPPEAAVQPPVRDRVEHPDLAGNLERMIEHGKHGAGQQPRFARALRGGGQEHVRVRAVAAVRLEIVLDRADLREAELVA